MKKLYLALLPSLLLAACSNKPLTKEALVGDWVCTTEYKDIHVGTVDFITLNSDGTLKDDSYILDHSISVLLDEKIDDFFVSPLRYLRISDGTWDLSGNTLTYDLKTRNFKRLFWKDIWEQIQGIDSLRKMEAESFNVYSSHKGGEIKLTFNKFIKDGFILNQDLYTSKCLNKNVSQYSYIEKYKEIHKVK